MGAVEAEPILARFVKDPVREVAETCQLALDRIAFFRSGANSSSASTRHTSVDPAPPLDGSLTINELLQHCMDGKQSLFHRYRAMFSLRDRATGEAALALCQCFEDESALFKHEVAFVLGQMQRNEAAPRLRAVLRDKSENIMVRHEAAEALGALTFDLSGETGGDETLELLRAHAHDEEAVVAHSALVALDIADYNISDEFQYALTAEALAQQTQPNNTAKD
jgi:deoxyhypusine monooxygenase